MFGDQINNTIQKSSGVLKQISDSLFNTRSLFTLVLSLLAAMVIGRFVAFLSRRLNKALGVRADKSKNLNTVNKLRRSETLIVLLVAIVRTLLFVLALYFWWVFTHPNQSPGAIIGASALFALIIGGVLSPVLRDLAFGSTMMSEHWFGVSDHVTIEPYTIQGIVERVTLRSTKIRSLSGESIWISNQNIAAVRVTPKGISTMALELFVSDLKKGLQLIEEVNLRLPIGPLMVVSPLAVMTTPKAGDQLWHITAIGQTAPERQWLIEKYARDLIIDLDAKNKHPVLLHEPLSRFADNEAERRFARSIHNAQKSKINRKIIPKKLTRNTGR